jgi:hypothetical protein
MYLRACGSELLRFFHSSGRQPEASVDTPDTVKFLDIAMVDDIEHGVKVVVVNLIPDLARKIQKSNRLRGRELALSSSKCHNLVCIRCASSGKVAVFGHGKLFKS